MLVLAGRQLIDIVVMAIATEKDVDLTATTNMLWIRSTEVC